MGLDKIPDKTNDDRIVAEPLYEVYHRGESGVNAQIVIELTNTSKIVIHVPDHLSKAQADMIFDMGKQMIEGEVAKGIISKEVGEAAIKKLRTELDKLVDKLAVSNHDIIIDLNEKVKIHLQVPDHLTKAAADNIFGIVKGMIDRQVAAGMATKEEAEAALKKL